MPAPHPRMHGISHVPGGPDPVPFGMVPTGNYPSLVMQLAGGPRGYWRLGEPAAPFLDTSGYNTTLPANLTRNTGTVAMTLDVAGALPGSQDDGAVVQNYAGNTSSTDGDADWLNWSTTDHRFAFGLTDPFSVAAWIRPQTSGNTFLGAVAGTWTDGVAGAYEAGWALWMSWPSQEIQFVRGGASGHETASGGLLPAGVWAHVAGTYDGTVASIYVNGLLAQAVTSASSVPVLPGIQVGNASPHRPGGSGGVSYRARFYGGVDEVAVWAAALTSAEVAALAGAATGSATGFAPAGSEPISDGAGGIGWEPPVTSRVTVNGKKPVAAATPKPPPTPPPTPPPPPPTHMTDQPFTYNGSTFTVQPKVWTTIPFTTPLMERFSDTTGLSAWAEIPIGDPAAAGWLHPDTPHTITIPHDMPFGAEAMLQVCLRIDNPIVQGTTSNRALRVLETTRMKTLLLVVSEQADGACAEGGFTDVFRGPSGAVFASGDPGGLHTGGHPDIFFAPNAGLAFYPSGYDWLPYIAGVQSLRKGMRLVAQCWHDASVPLTFSCAPGTTYKPHFVVNADCDPAWGPPWSTW